MIYFLFFSLIQIVQSELELELQEYIHVISCLDDNNITVSNEMIPILFYFEQPHFDEDDDNYVKPEETLTDFDHHLTETCIRVNIQCTNKTHFYRHTYLFNTENVSCINDRYIYDTSFQGKKYKNVPRYDDTVFCSMNGIPRKTLIFQIKDSYNFLILKELYALTTQDTYLHLWVFAKRGLIEEKIQEYIEAAIDFYELDDLDFHLVMWNKETYRMSCHEVTKHNRKVFVRKISREQPFFRETIVPLLLCGMIILFLFIFIYKVFVYLVKKVVENALNKVL